MKLEITQQAQKSIISIYEWNLRNHSQSRALKIINSIQTTFKIIKRNPYIFQKFTDTDIESDFIRKATVGETYKIIFRIDTERIVILDLYHGMDNPEKGKSIKSGRKTNI